MLSLPSSRLFTRSVSSSPLLHRLRPEDLSDDNINIGRTPNLVNGEHRSSVFGGPKIHVKHPLPGVHPLTNRVHKVAANPAPGRARRLDPTGVRPIRQKKMLPADDVDRPDSGRATDITWSDPPAHTGISASIPTERLSAPTSRRSLYRNILFMTSSPSFSIREAVDYYFDCPKPLHSTKSFNLLISISLRNASFASVSRLFIAMQAESIPANMETWKLHVRWLVRTGKLNNAWKRVLEITGQQNVSAKFSIPLPLWLELFGSQKRGALRHWVITDRKPNVKAGSAADHGLTSDTISRAGRHISPDAGRDVLSDVRLEGDRELLLNAGVEDAGNPTPLLRKRLMPCSCQSTHAVELSRYRALMQVSPLLASTNRVQILPRTILVITQAMYQVGQRTLALSTALSYVKSLPPRLRRCDRRRVLDLVNFHLSVVTRHRKPGLKQHFTQRRILWKFLHARPDLTPSSATLFLLLGPLRSCRRSGTLAMQCLHLFEKRWGPRVQSRLVRRRVATLALKEGRLDIVEAMLRLEWRCRVSDGTFPRTICISRRRPWRTLFTRQGAENRRWHLVGEKYRRRLTSRTKS